MEIDPVCGMSVDPSTAAGAWPHRGRTYYFCSVGCLERFKADPEGVLATRAEDRSMEGPSKDQESTGVSMYGYASKKDDLQSRLRKIEGQVRGLQRMVDEDKYCIDILTQVNSVTAALRAVGMGLLDDHVRHCVAESIATGDGDEKIEELMAAVGRFAGK